MSFLVLHLSDDKLKANAFRILIAISLLPSLSACVIYPGRVPEVVNAAVASREIVYTSKGPVKGTSAPAGRVFLGIPFAEPPVGNLRWRPPQPVVAWTSSLDATKAGSPCMQAIGLKTVGGGGGGIVVGKEDCLYLNIYAPPASTQAYQSRLPVMVYFPGGAFLVGSSDNYNPLPLARSQNVIIVTVNYRLGAFGFLAHPDLAKESPKGGSGNFGLLDQQAALRWVKKEISSFGGDPDEVTLFGESAGAWSVCYQMTSPAAAGLFHRAIMQSGSCTEKRSLVSISEAESGGEEFAKALKCQEGEAVPKCLRDAPPNRVAKAPATRTGLASDKSWGPVWGDNVVPLNPQIAFETGRYHRVPAIIGSNRNEGRLFSFLVTSQKDYRQRLEAEFGRLALSVMEQYPVEKFGTASHAYAAVLTDSRFACPARDLRDLLSPRSRVLGYEFADETAPFRYSIITGRAMGAYHAAELTYLFGSSWALADFENPTEKQSELSALFMRDWGSFAHGRPLGQQWQVYGGYGDRLLSGAGTSTADERPASFNSRHRCQFWSSVP